MGSGCDWLRKLKQVNTAAIATACCNFSKNGGADGDVARKYHDICPVGVPVGGGVC